MSTITTKEPAQSSPSGRFTVDQFERIADSLDDDQVELIDGHVVGMGEMKPPHALVSQLLRECLQPMLSMGRYIREDKPVRIPDHDEPRPEISIFHGNPRVYATHHPMPKDVSLLIEISDTTLHKDRNEKMPS
jgi:hypothetical protein